MGYGNTTDGNKISLSDITINALRFLLGTGLSGPSPAFVIKAGGSPIPKNGAATAIKVDNVVTALAANTDFPITGATQADGTTYYYLLCSNGSTHKGVQGTTTALPACPAGYAPIGYLKIATTGATFVPATTALDAGTATVTYVNLAGTPLALV